MSNQKIGSVVIILKMNLRVSIKIAFAGPAAAGSVAGIVENENVDFQKRAHHFRDLSSV